MLGWDSEMYNFELFCEKGEIADFQTHMVHLTTIVPSLPKFVPIGEIS